MDFEFYETPQTFTRYLFQAMTNRGLPIYGNIFEPTVGSGAIVRAAPDDGLERRWVSNDLDTRWASDFHEDATETKVWNLASGYFDGSIDWTIANPPFTPAIEILTRAIENSRFGVAMHLRASIHEVLKTGVRRTWMFDHPPTGILWLPRFGYQRSKSTGKWTTDSVCACWVIWMRDPISPQFIEYAPPYVIDVLADETPIYRARMDALMGRM